jgi:hypothetical protein
MKDKLVECEIERILSASDDDIMLAELRRLYNYTEDDSRQFTRWQMIAAMNHGHRLAQKHFQMLRNIEDKALRSRLTQEMCDGDK